MSHKDRIHGLKKELGSLAGGKIEAWISDALPPDAAEQFCRDVVAFETAPTTTNFQQLADAGVALPHPDEVSDLTISGTLWTVIHGLAALGVFLSRTDHLSDRELYSVLWKNVLREEVPILPTSSHGAWHVDLPGGDPESRQYLKFYADDDFRRHWQEECPDYDMPAHENLPHDRDRHLPTLFDEPEGDARH